jgi:hypothetical protein
MYLSEFSSLFLVKLALVILISGDIYEKNSLLSQELVNEASPRSGLASLTNF